MCPYPSVGPHIRYDKFSSSRNVLKYDTSPFLGKRVDFLYVEQVLMEVGSRNGRSRVLEVERGQTKGNC